MAEYQHGTYSVLAATVGQETEVAATIPVYVGSAPVNLIRGYADADLVNNPVQVNNLLDGYSKIGYSADWDSYNLSEVLFAHFGSASTPIGHFWCVNVLDPDIHRKEEPVTREIVWNAGKASFDSTDIILDTLTIAKDTPEYTQQAAFRPAGPNEAAGTAAQKRNYDYAGKYAEAGLGFDGRVLSYEPTGTIDPGIVHDGYAFAGLVFPKPETATKVTVSINGDSDEVDLTQDGESVVGGELVRYFGFATADGAPLADKAFDVTLAWYAGDEPLETTDITIVRGEADDAFIEGADYTLTYDFRLGRVQLASVDRANPMTGVTTVTYEEVDPSQIGVEDIIGYKTEEGEYVGLGAIDLIYPFHNEVVNLLAAPGWSHIPEIYRALIETATKINGHWDAFVQADIPLVDADGNAVDTIAKAIRWKDANLYNDERSSVWWPKAVDADGHIFHLSTLASVETLRVDLENNNLPYETCSNKPVPVIRQYFGPDNKSRGYDEQTGNRLNAMGIGTVIARGGQWVLWGPHTAAFFWGSNGVIEGPDESVDERAYYASGIRMLYYIGNSFQAEWIPQIDEPLTRALADRIRAREQEKLDSLVAQGALVGEPTVTFNADNNPLSSMLSGDFVWDIEGTPANPLKSATVNVAYTDAGLSTYFEEA